MKEPTLPFADPDPAPAPDPGPGRPDAIPLPGTRERPWSVSEINEAARECLESRWGDVWLQGEISNFKPHSSGHWYFSLKDDRGQIQAVMFRSANARVRFRAEDGHSVLVRGRITMYTPRGTYQINIQAMEPLGLGALQIAFEQLKRRLQAEGLFDPDRKRPIPAMPRRVAVVTSPTGAALRDVLHVLARRAPGLPVLVVPCPVQGEAAPPLIVEALQRIHEHAAATPKPGRAEDHAVDVIILARGGGSLEDLWPFNDERVARAIAASEIPIISAVGHETDVTIADFVADLRAPTPSAAAEVVTRSRDELRRQVSGTAQRLVQAGRMIVLRARHAHREIVTRRGFLRVETLLAEARQRHDEASTRIQRALIDRIRAHRERLGLAAERLSPRSLKAEIASRSSRLEAVIDQLAAAARARVRALRDAVVSHRALLGSLSPVAVLDRGYAICQDETSGRVITSAAAVAAGDAIRVRLARGRIGARVTRTEPEPASARRPGKGRTR